MNLQNRNRLTDIENRLVVAKGERGWGRDKLGVWDQQMQTTVQKIDKQQGPNVQHRELYSISLLTTYNGKEYEKEKKIYN